MILSICEKKVCLILRWPRSISAKLGVERVVVSCYKATENNGDTKGSRRIVLQRSRKMHLCHDYDVSIKASCNAKIALPWRPHQNQNHVSERSPPLGGDQKHSYPKLTANLMQLPLISAPPIAAGIPTFVRPHPWKSPLSFMAYAYTLYIYTLLTPR